jgi:outer membrane protein assembly factor BamD (BamD/ComL family)
LEDLPGFEEPPEGAGEPPEELGEEPPEADGPGELLPADEPDTVADSFDLGGEGFDLGGEAGGLDLGGEELDLGGEAGGPDLGGDTGGAVPLGDDEGNPPPGLTGNLAGDLDGEGETADFLSGLEDLPGFEEPPEGAGEPPEELGEEPPEADGPEELLPADGPDTVADSFDLGGEGFDLGGDAGGLDFGDGGFSPGETTLDSGGAPEGSKDPFETFNIDNDAFPADFTFGDELGGGGPTEPSAGDFSKGDENFDLPGLDDIFGDQKERAAPGGSRPGTARGTEKGGGAQEVEEIQLGVEELAQFQRTLSSYPLNLRVACEELIAEQAVAPDLMSRLIKLLVTGAPAKETAALAGKILGRAVQIPKGFEKKTGEALEEEQASFAYVFVHNFLPVLRLFLMIAAVGLSLVYLAWQFIYIPLKADSIYKTGIERIDAGEYDRANERFIEAFRIKKVKKWFYLYAEAFRDTRQYDYAERKYDELLANYPRDKKGVLDYAYLETRRRRNYEKADDLLRRNILDYAPADREGLLALGDNNLAWGEIDGSRYEAAREAYAKLIETYGQSDPILERMMKYFIRTDQLKEVLPLQTYFMGSPKRKIAPSSLAELGDYLLTKRFEKVPGVPNEFLDRIGGIREVLLRVIKEDPGMPEGYYHLARYYNYFDNPNDERLTLERAVEKFESAPEESVRRLRRHIDARRRYGELLINSREFFPAEEQLLEGIRLYRDGLSRRILVPSPEFGRLYADLGDLEYFTRGGNMAISMETALDYYGLAERSGYAPPEILYRMGAALYDLRDWENALNRLFAASSAMPFNRRILYALGNAAYLRGDYFAAQGYYNRLLDILESDRVRFPLTLPNEQGEQLELAERLMTAHNNLGVTLEALTRQTGSNSYRSRAFSLYAESERAWDAITRNPQTMNRLGPLPGNAGPGVNPAYLNVQNSLHPVPGYEPQFFYRIDKDVLEPSAWEELAPPQYRLFEGLAANRG